MFCKVKRSMLLGLAALMLAVGGLAAVAPGDAAAMKCFRGSGGAYYCTAP